MRGLAPIWLYSSHIQHETEWKNNIISFIVLFKTPTKYQEFFPTSFVKTTDFQLVFNFEQSHAVTIYGEHGIMAHTMMAKPIRAVETNYPMNQFLIIPIYITT